jgi:hypothetical protein
VVTRAGGNDIHGTIYEFFRNDALDTRNYFSTAVEPLKQNQFGVTAGGPIRKDRLFAFAYYEGFRNRQGNHYRGMTFAKSPPSCVSPCQIFWRTLNDWPVAPPTA